MKTIMMIAAFGLLVSVNAAQAQEGTMKKKAEVGMAKAQVTTDKAALDANKAARKADKMTGDKAALKADRKAHMKAEGKLVKDQAKKDVKVVKEKL